MAYFRDHFTSTFTCNWTLVEERVTNNISQGRTTWGAAQAIQQPPLAGLWGGIPHGVIGEREYPPSGCLPQPGVPGVVAWNSDIRPPPGFGPRARPSFSPTRPSLCSPTRPSLIGTGLLRNSTTFQELQQRNSAQLTHLASSTIHIHLGCEPSRGDHHHHIPTATSEHSPGFFFGFFVFFSLFFEELLLFSYVVWVFCFTSPWTHRDLQLKPPQALLKLWAVTCVHKHTTEPNHENEKPLEPAGQNVSRFVAVEKLCRA